MLRRSLECCGHEALESGLLAHELIDRPGMSAVERDTGFPQMTERALHMRACGRVHFVEMQVVAKGVLSGPMRARPVKPSTTRSSASSHALQWLQA